MTIGSAPVLSAKGRAGALLSARWPEVILGVVLVSTYVALRGISVSHDVVWQMWIARQLLGGARLYTGIVELNPPLWFWMGVPVEWMAQKIDISSTWAIVAAMFLLIAAGLALLALLWSDRRPLQRALLLGAAFLAFVVIPLPEFGQREHICLIGTAVYAALMARRVSGLPVDWRLAVAAGLLAAAGFALKHYFVLAPVLLEVWLIGVRRRGWSPLRPETIVLAASAASYAAAILLLAPDFFTFVVPLLTTAYGGYGASVEHLLAGSTMIVWMVSILVLLSSRASVSDLSNGFAIAALAFIVAYLAQQKGWPYHAMPVDAFLFLALAAVAGQVARTRWYIFRMAAIAGCMLIPLHGAYVAGAYSNPNSPAFDQLMKNAEPGSGAVVLTAYPSGAWPMIEDAQLKWPSRHFALWMLHAISDQMREHGQLTGRLVDLAETTRRQMVEDLACNPPDYVVIDEASRWPHFDFLEYLRENAQFERLFADYRRTDRAGRYVLYEISGQAQSSRPAECRSIF